MTGGPISATVLMLFVLPALYTLFGSRRPAETIELEPMRTAAE